MKFKAPLVFLIK